MALVLQKKVASKAKFLLKKLSFLGAKAPIAWFSYFQLRLHTCKWNIWAIFQNLGSIGGQSNKWSQSYRVRKQNLCDSKFRNFALFRTNGTILKVLESHFCNFREKRKNSNCKNFACTPCILQMNKTLGMQQNSVSRKMSQI